MEDAGGPVPCSVAALGRGDPLLATAPTSRRMLLVEVHGPWGAAGLTATRLPAPVVGRLAETAEVAGVRVQVVRPPGRHPEVRESALAGPYRWALADPEAGVVRWGRYADPVELLGIDLVERWDPTVHAGTGPQRVALVCAHAKKDLCCALRGRAVAATLAQALDREVWETSHLGGDRFAANLVLLPEGEVFGRLDPASAVEVARRLDAGRLVLGSHRGRLGLTPAAQAALHFAAVELDDDRRDAVRLAGAPERDGARWLAVVEHAGRRYDVRFEEWWAEPEYLSCSASAPKPARRFAVRSFGQQEVQHAG
jgi:hypothetical protein